MRAEGIGLDSCGNGQAWARESVGAGGTGQDTFGSEWDWVQVSTGAGGNCEEGWQEQEGLGRIP